MRPYCLLGHGDSVFHAVERGLRRPPYRGRGLSSALNHGAVVMFDEARYQRQEKCALSELVQFVHQFRSMGDRHCWPAFWGDLHPATP